MRASIRSLAAAFLLSASPAAAEPLDWSAVGRHDVIEVLTVDPDGERRETRVWVAALDGRGYVRTNDSRWFQNLEREPVAAVRAGGSEYAVRAELVRDPELRRRVDGEFAKKYPISTWIMRLFGRTGGRNCLALVAAE